MSVLRIAGGRVEVCAEVDVGTPVVAVSFSADGRRAFVVKTDTHRLGVLHIDESGATPRVSHDPAEDLTTGLVPFNLVVSPDGALALVVDMGSPTASDGHADSISVVDLAATPPRVIDRIMVEDGPEGIAISPDGRFAAVAIVRGSNNPSSEWFHHPRGQIVLLRIEGRRVTRAGAIEVGALPRASRSVPTAATSTSATSSPRTCRCWPSAMTVSPIPAPILLCPAAPPRCGRSLTETATPSLATGVLP
ncbi:hypothetical protein FQZ97_757890 [compost metagenome]